MLCRFITLFRWLMDEWMSRWTMMGGSRKHHMYVHVLSHKLTEEAKDLGFRYPSQFIGGFGLCSMCGWMGPAPTDHFGPASEILRPVPPLHSQLRQAHGHPQHQQNQTQQTYHSL